MSRVDVIKAEKGKFKVLVNFIQQGVHYTTSSIANREATAIHSTMPNASLTLVQE